MTENQLDKGSNVEPSKEPEPKESEAILNPFLAEAPPKVQREVKKLIQMTGMSISGVMPDPLAQKVTSEHITKMIEYTEADGRRTDRQMYSHRRYVFAYFLVGVLVVVGLLILLVLRGDKDFALQVITALGAFGGGFGISKLTGR